MTKEVVDLMAALERSLGIKPPPEDIGTEPWLRERFPEKDWHRHPRTDGRTDLCDGTPSDCGNRGRGKSRVTDE
jgi:hypothetical protein